MAAPRRTSGLTTTVIAIALLPSTSFCWKLVIASFLVTYYYYLYFIAGTFRLPRGVHVISSKAMRFAAQKALQITILAVFSVWCLSMTPVHLPTFISAFTPYTIHEPLRKTDVVYDAGENAVVDIFAIHGLGSKPDNSWIYNPNATRIRWLSLIPQIEGLRDIRVVEANHRTRWDLNTVQMNFQDYASDLLELIESRHKAHPDRPILFIAYSFSGLLLKKALLLAKSQSTDVAATTRAIIFIGVPHRGAPDTFIASCLSCMSFFRGSSSNMLETMSFDNPTLIDLESEFYDEYVLQHHRYEKQPYICDVLESRPDGGIPRHGRVVTLDTDHRSLAKFQSGSDPNFQVLVNIISQAIDYAVPAGTSTITRQDTQAPSDILDYVSYGLPWAARSRKAAALLGGLEELVASWLAGDLNRFGRYFTARCLKMVLYRSLATAFASQGLGWVLRKVFEGHISNTARLLQVLLSNTIVCDRFSAE
ncbi:hypothetical protein F4821DRAFT_270034 [Hypoxylon rubiginosum]|uniref:Uncharacterized protein n=1 Tax=Hypoxylon rubiginosum TaxID=110542 RepID=A0ACC0D1A9_9PEZI|nr:hypothetical protein F4821DRAFT_270034 [Hypoxylon rubiginosum]